MNRLTLVIVNHRASKLPKRQFIRENRKMIDEVISNVTGNKKPAHYLAYPNRNIR